MICPGSGLFTKQAFNCRCLFFFFFFSPPLAHALQILAVGASLGLGSQQLQKCGGKHGGKNPGWEKATFCACALLGRVKSRLEDANGASLMSSLFSVTCRCLQLQSGSSCVDPEAITCLSGSQEHPDLRPLLDCVEPAVWQLGVSADPVGAAATGKLHLAEPFCGCDCTCRCSCARMTHFGEVYQVLMHGDAQVLTINYAIRSDGSRTNSWQ